MSTVARRAQRWQLRPPPPYTWAGGSWSLDGNGRAYNTPTLGSELLTDPSLEAWSSATNATSYTESIVGSSSINQESSVVHSGTYAARIDVDGSNSFAALNQVYTASIGQWIQASAWMRSSAASGKSHRIDQINTNAPTLAMALTNTYQKFFISGRVTAASPTFSSVRQTASHSAYVDDASVKPLTLATLFTSTDGGYSNLPVAARIAVIGAQCGIVSLLDSAASPANFLIAYHDGANVVLDKCVGGTYTNLVSTPVSFVAHAQIEIRRPSGNTFQVWYNGSQRGTDQTVSDAGIISNTRYGLFSTYLGNLFSEFSLNGLVIPLTQLGA